ncbi:glutamate--tRNA ligase [Micromonospora parva]|uniref:glutamate--tRNA ligase n=1 Tax=Micromonospora parva TaxID=1464048 RepID=UPI0033DC3AD4
MSDEVRVRFAPNGEMPFPSFITRTILYSWLFARRHGGTFVLRLDDTDVDRQMPGALQSYPDGMRWLGLDWDEGPEIGGAYGPYRQSERLPLYQQAVQELLTSGAAYRCYCSPERLAALAAQARTPGRSSRAYDGRCRTPNRRDQAEAARQGREPAIRLRVPDEGVVISHDLIRGPITVAAESLSDIVICRPDGWATYHLTVVVDDTMMRISHVIRGVEGLSNMAPQAIVYRALGLEPPLYLHHPLVRIPGFAIGERFLPRGHLLYLDELKAAGYPPEAVINYYGLLGYGDDGQDVRTLAEMIESFDFARVSRKEFVNQSLEKLAWMNRVYLRSAAPATFVEELIRDRLSAAGTEDRRARAIAARATPVLRRRISSADEINGLLRFATTDWAPGSASPEAQVWAKMAAEAVAAGQSPAATIRALAAGDRGEYGRIVRTLLAQLGGADTPLSLAECIEVLGPGESVRRWSSVGN